MPLMIIIDEVILFDIQLIYEYLYRRVSKKRKLTIVTRIQMLS